MGCEGEHWRKALEATHGCPCRVAMQHSGRVLSRSGRGGAGHNNALVWGTRARGVVVAGARGKRHR